VVMRRFGKPDGRRGSRRHYFSIGLRTLGQGTPLDDI
jgi:hypothetical protein